MISESSQGGLREKEPFGEGGVYSQSQLTRIYI